MKRVILLLLSLGMAHTAYSQWTKQDSLNLKRILDGKEELRLNKKTVRDVDFGGVNDTLRASTHKSWMQPDETLPTVPYEPINEEPDTLGAEARPAEVSGAKITIEEMNIKLPKIEGIPLGRGVRLSKVTVTRVTDLTNPRSAGSSRSFLVKIGFSGLDFMSVFTRKFWERKERQNSQQTRQVLKSY